MSSSTSPDVTAIGQIAVIAKDVDRAVTFYRDVLGLRFLFRAGNLAFFDCGGVRLLVEAPEDPEFRHHASVIYYKVADIHASAASLKSHGVTLVAEPHVIAKMPDHDLWMTFFRDTENNMLALMSEMRG